MIIGYKVQMVGFYDDFAGGGETEIFSNVFPTYELAKKQFDVCKKYITETETKCIMEDSCIKNKSEFLKKATRSEENYFGIADYELFYWGTQVNIYPVKSTTEITTEF